MKINCISCGFKFDLDDAYDDFNGPVTCYTCKAPLEIQTQQGKLKSIIARECASAGGHRGRRSTP